MKHNLKISRIQENDLEQFKELVTLLNEVFEEPQKIASEKQLKKLLKDSCFLAITALQEGKVIGGLTAYQLEQYYTDKSEIFIYDIAVKTELHNQGIGKKLIDFLKDFSAKNDIRGIFVEAHSEDEHAVTFYQSTFGKSEKVDHFFIEIETK